jgi:Rps23 Pro-64 3,4-dihydroxylase Tpa1-like proline 4-hydroxylase
MDISRPQFRSPIICIDNFLSETEADLILQECIDLKRVYMPSSVFHDFTSSKIDPEYRTNEVVYLDEVFRSAPDRSAILRIMKHKIWTEECRGLWHQGYYIFDIINYATWQESVVSYYGDGAFYKKHQDTRWDHITYRLVSLVYYVNKAPAGFTGGELILWHETDHLRIEPLHNRAVIFPSFCYHEVEPVRMRNDVWESGRFSLNHWIGFR